MFITPAERKTNLHPLQAVGLSRLEGRTTLTIFGGKHKLCDGVSRRDFLKIGALGTGLALADLLRARAAAPGSSAKSAIMIWLCGGPSQLETYDLKPEAPAELRGEFKPIATNVPGVQISEYFPLQARMWDKLSVIRSVRPVDGGHSDSGVFTRSEERRVGKECRL